MRTAWSGMGGMTHFISRRQLEKPLCKHAHRQCLCFMWFSSSDSVERVMLCVVHCLSALHVTNPNATAAW